MSDDLELRVRLTGEAGGLKTASSESAKAVAGVGDAAEQAAARAQAAAQKITTAAQAEAAALKAVANAQASASAAAKANGISAGQTAAAFRQLPQQLSDVFVSLQGGMPILTVLSQQGPQITGAFGGLGPTFTALRAAVSPAWLALGTGVGVLAALYAAQSAGEAESQAYTRAIVMSGNAAGTTFGALNAMAQAVGSITGTQGQAAAVLAQIAGQSRIAGENVGLITEATVRMRRVVGQETDETVKMFAEVGKAPLAASLKVNEAYHHMTVAVYDQIKALQEAGRADQAAALAQRVLAEELIKRTQAVEINAGLMERAWARVKGAAASAWDAMLGIGRQKSGEDQVKQIDAQIAMLDSRKSEDPARTKQRRDVLVEQRDLLRMSIEQVNVAAAEKKAVNDATEARAANAKWVDAGLTKQQQMNAALAEYRANNQRIRAGGGTVDAAEVARTEASIREKFADKGAAKGAEQEAKARTEAAVQRVKDELAGMTAAYANGERVLDAMRSAQLLGEGEYWEAKRAFIRLNADEQVRALAAENAALAKQGGTAAERVKAQAEIAQNTAEMARVRAKAAADQVVADTQEAASLRTLTAASAAYERQLLQTLAAQARQGKRQVADVGRSDREREIAAREGAIDDDVEAQRRQLYAEREVNKIPQAVYEERLAKLTAYHQAALAGERQHQLELQRAQGDASLGMDRALKNYLDKARDAAGATEAAWSSAFQGAEEAAVKFVRTGKIDIASLGDTIVATIIRVAVQQQAARLMSGFDFSSFFGGKSSSTTSSGSLGTDYSLATGGAKFGGQKASGGETQAGKFYEVNERGPELLTVGNRTFLMMGKRDGWVTPPDTTLARPQAPAAASVGAAGAGPMTLNVPITLVNNTGTPMQATGRQRSDGGIEVLIDQLESAMADRVSNGYGTLGPAIEGRYDLRPGFGTR